MISFQSMCLDRPPLIHTDVSKVSMPTNCNDADVTETSIIPRPIEVPTDMSALICRAEAFRIFRQLYSNAGAYLNSYCYVQSIDRQIEGLIEHFPWYFRIGSEKCLQHLPTLDNIAWQHESLHISICLQRIRMNRPFLHARIGESWGVCFRAAKELLAPYRRMREVDPDRFRYSQKFKISGYNSYTAAVTLAAFLLVERSLPGFSSECMRQDIEMVISDLELQDLGPLISDGVKILWKMLDMFDHRRDTKDPNTREALVRDIASVFGGEHPTRRYLKQGENGGQSDNTTMNTTADAFTGSGSGSYSGAGTAGSISSTVSSLCTADSSAGQNSKSNSRDSVETAMTVPSPGPGPGPGGLVVSPMTADLGCTAAQEWGMGIRYPQSSTIPATTAVNGIAKAVTVNALEQQQHNHRGGLGIPHPHPHPHPHHHHHHHHHAHPLVVGGGSQQQNQQLLIPCNSNDQIDFSSGDLSLALGMLDSEQLWDMNLPELSYY